MFAAVIVTAAFLPIYLLLREPFRRLPLHIDTGFYVANHTVTSRRFSFRKGWNAHYAGCSKAWPELFYSFIYLTTLRRLFGFDDYQRLSRLCASLFNYATAVAAGVLAVVLSDGDMRCYYAGFLCLALLSSEPHYGVYFECAELFEVLAHVASAALLAIGLSQENPWWVGLSAFLWAADAYFCKLSSGIAWIVFYGMAAILAPWTLAPSVGGLFAASALYWAWCLYNGRHPLRLVIPLRGHEVSFNRRAGGRGLWHRLTEKVRCLGRTVRHQPVFPLLAIVGFLCGNGHHELLWLYFAAVIAAYLAQATDCRYYLIPLLPPLSLWAADGALFIGSSGAIGVAALSLIAAAWLLHNPIRAARLCTAELNRWSWKGYRSAQDAARNLQLTRAAELLAPIAAGKTLLVYGPFNQAYVLLGASYDTELVAAEHYLDDTLPGWQRRLNARFMASPPGFILDTSSSFDARAARERLGFHYRLTHLLGGWLRLYRLDHASLPQPDYLNARTFGVPTRAALAAELARGGDSVVISEVDGSRDSFEDETAADLRALLHDLARQGYRRLAVYGAGRFTLRHADLYRESPVPVAVVLDDRPDRVGGRLLDWPVTSPDKADEFNVDAVILSTDRFAAPMRAKIRRCWSDRLPAFTIRAE